MIKIYEELDQGSDAWFSARCGLLTASEMKLVITPTGKVAVNDKATAHLHEIEVVENFIWITHCCPPF